MAERQISDTAARSLAVTCELELKEDCGNNNVLIGLQSFSKFDFSESAANVAAQLCSQIANSRGSRSPDPFFLGQ